MKYPNQYRNTTFSISRVLYESVMGARVVKVIKMGHAEARFAKGADAANKPPRERKQYNCGVFSGAVDSLIDDLKHGEDRMSALSVIDHLLTYASHEQRVEYFMELPENFEDLDLHSKAWLAAYAEAVCNFENVTPPAWVFNSEYIIDPRENEIVKLYTSMGRKVNIEEMLAEALPEFRSRGFFSTTVFASV